MASFSGGIRLVPGCNVTDRQMRLYMKFRRTEPVPIDVATARIECAAVVAATEALVNPA
jgi:hypothetical protein